MTRLKALNREVTESLQGSVIIFYEPCQHRFMIVEYNRNEFSYTLSICSSK